MDTTYLIHTDAPGDAPQDTPASEEISHLLDTLKARVRAGGRPCAIRILTTKPRFQQVPKDEAPVAGACSLRQEGIIQKKREVKGPAATEARDSPDPGQPSQAEWKTSDVSAPLCYKLFHCDLNRKASVFTPSHTISVLDKHLYSSHEASDWVTLRPDIEDHLLTCLRLLQCPIKNHCHRIVDPEFSSLFYHQSETAPFTPRLYFL